jgi:hypothetical protein
MRKPHIRLFWLLPVIINHCIQHFSDIVSAAVHGEAPRILLPSRKSRCERSNIRCVHLISVEPERLNVLERTQGPERPGFTKNLGCLKVDGNKSSIRFLGTYIHFTPSLCSSVASLRSGTASVIDSPSLMLA